MTFAEAQVHIIVNKDMLAAKAGEFNPKDLVVAMRPLSTDPTARFSVLGNQQVAKGKDQIVVEGLAQLDGQYVVLMSDNMLKGKDEGHGEGS